jgi:hypothetical protein
MVIHPGRRRTVRWNVTATESTTAAGMATTSAGMATTAALGKGRLRNHQENDERAERCPHNSSASRNGKGSAVRLAICNLRSAI